MNRFTSRSGLSIDVDEMTESFSVLLVEGNLVCLGFGVGGWTEAGVAGREGGGSCVCRFCCSSCDGDCGGCTGVVGCGGTSTGGRGVLVATDCF